METQTRVAVISGSAAACSTLYDLNQDGLGDVVLVERDELTSVTSGDWGHRAGLNLALAYRDPAYAAPGTKVTLDLLGSAIVADVIPPSAYNPGFLIPQG